MALHILWKFVMRSVQHALLWILVAVILLYTLVGIALTIPPPPWFRTMLETVAQHLRKEVTAIPWSKLVALLFLNNVRIALLLSIPLINIALLVPIVFMTAWLGRILAEMVAGKSWTLIVVMLIATPHSYLEFIAYSIVLTEGVYLGWKIVKRKAERADLYVHGLYIAMSIIILALAAMVEASLMRLPALTR
ncbi:MAG TPA: stage II sporulation protein M [Ignisphaera aggregans]|uniref:Stage II sporulation protein M n=1 Tax=Ignisphaera aggregans TaxID=334771 RepID=A0A833DU52_9CREN|nr:stage II sporulation protein M [Ignisphaera aggregans]